MGLALIQLRESWVHENIDPFFVGKGPTSGTRVYCHASPDDVTYTCCVIQWVPLDALQRLQINITRDNPDRNARVVLVLKGFDIRFSNADHHIFIAGIYPP